MLKGIGLIGFGIFSVIWVIVKVIASILIAGLISSKVCGLTGVYWWCSSIILFCVINKIIFHGTDSSYYGNLVDKYNGKCNDEEYLTEDKMKWDN